VTAPSLAAAVAVAGVCGFLAVLVVPVRTRGSASGVGTAVVGVLTMWLAGATFASGFPAIHVGWLVPLAGAEFGGDATSGLFTFVTGAVAVAAGIFTIGYGRASRLSTPVLATIPVFVAAMALVPFAASVTTFLLLWEAMALTSLVLVLADHTERTTRDAGVAYAVTTQLGFMAILLGLVAFAADAHGETFAALGAAHLGSSVRAAVFVLTVIGFGAKAGLVPLHAWLPQAHPAAPSPVSALMSGAMVNLGIYGLVRVDVRLLGPGPQWCGLALMVAGGLTAVYSVLQASVATDLKRLLAYSTGENMGLVTLAVGAASLLASVGNLPVAAVAMAAALLHVVNHASFKCLGFLSAGAVVARTGVRDLDRLGGLARRMPITTTMFGIAALGAAGLPLGAGFVSEWLLLQSLIHTLPAGGTMLALVMPLAVGVVALTAGLAVAAMVKAFGIGFLARPRSAEAASAHEVPASMVVAMALSAMVCAVLAVAPVVTVPLLRDAVMETSGASASGPRLGLVLRLPGIAGSMSPALLAAVTVVAFLAVLVFGAVRARSARPTTVPLWACGGGPLTARMQYTATSFAEPLQRVFDDVLRPDIDIDVSHHVESRYLLEKVTYRSRVSDTIETRLYAPIVKSLNAWAHLVRRAHAGSVHAYLGYGAAGLLVALLVAR
jgi:formate hydrogenlyase subunit 3/multisubunit Na+/H+ antiporter MnhD subunit